MGETLFFRVFEEGSPSLIADGTFCGSPNNRVWQKESSASCLLAPTLAEGSSILWLQHPFADVRINFSGLPAWIEDGQLSKNPPGSQHQIGTAAQLMDSQSLQCEAVTVQLPRPYHVRQPSKPLF